MQILIIDDDLPVRRACAEIAATVGLTAQTTDSVPAARTLIARGGIDLVLLDLKVPGSGLALLEELRLRHPSIIVIIMTAYATVNSAVEAMRLGAADYLTKPFTLEELSLVLERSAQRRNFDRESRTVRDLTRNAKGMGNLIGRSPVMEKLYRILMKVSQTTHPVLIQGESGVGKELVARSIHDNSPHATRPFIPVDCASLNPNLIEGELFGYAKGVFEGATRPRAGLLVTADGGTVFLDEIGDLPLDLQGKLLRALREKEIRPVGASQTVPIQARILAATNRNLAQMVEAGQFRKDLFFHLNVVNLSIPPLREHKSDIPLLVANSLDKIRRETGIAYSFSDDAVDLLMFYDWPGNVRELELTIDHATTLSSGPILHLADLPKSLREGVTQLNSILETSASVPFPPSFNPIATDNAPVVRIADLEKQAILNTIRKLKGDKLMAAKLLGIGKTTLYRKLKEYGITDDQTLT